MASLLNMSGGSLLEKGLPYDAEIEYLMNTGEGNAIEQYIDIDYIPKLNTRVVGRFMPHRGKEITNGNLVFGCRIRWQYYIFELMCPVNTENRVAFSRGSRNDERTLLDSSPFERIIDFDVSNNIEKYMVDGKIFSTPSVNLDVVYTLKMFIMATNDNNTSLRGKSLNLYYIKIYEGDVLVYDLIPVRKGTIGYLYDKVSGQLFGNAGTGAFILGPDKTN